MIPSLASIFSNSNVSHFQFLPFFSNTSSTYPFPFYIVFKHYLSLISITLDQVLDAWIEITVSYKASLQFVSPSCLHKAVRILSHQQLFSVIRKLSSVTKLNIPSVLQGLQWILVASHIKLKFPNTVHYVLYKLCRVLSTICPHFSTY